MMVRMKNFNESFGDAINIDHHKKSDEFWEFAIPVPNKIIHSKFQETTDTRHWIAHFPLDSRPRCPLCV